jgi:hypothetical protein
VKQTDRERLALRRRAQMRARPRICTKNAMSRTRDNVGARISKGKERVGGR